MAIATSKPLDPCANTINVATDYHFVPPCVAARNPIAITAPVISWV